MFRSDQATESATRIELDGEPLSIGQVQAVGRGTLRVSVTSDATVLKRMREAAFAVHCAVEEGEQVYGVTTGFGSMAHVTVPKQLAALSQTNLLSFLAAGVGRPLDRRHVRAAMVLRANMLLRGHSGVRLEIVERLTRFLEADAVPLVRELGSIGASGDLVPLATIARAITGQGAACRVEWEGREIDNSAALAQLGLEPLELLPKEALAIVNGTSFSTAIAANAIFEATSLLALTLALHAIKLRALCAHEEPFDAFVHNCKPHPGQVWTARVMRRALFEGTSNTVVDRGHDHLQDRYSLRCLPQYLGPIAEGIARVAASVMTEMNSVSDNPLIDPERERFFQSGNFLGQYVGMGMDEMRRYLGLMAKHVDVQIAQLVSPEFNHGLPPSLTGNPDISYNMGLKGLQIAGNSIMPLLTYFGNPLVEHFPTHAEQYNQNVNSLSWGAANLAWNSVELYQQYAAIAALFAVQAADLRANLQLGHYDGRALLGTLTEPLYAAVYDAVGAVPGDGTPLIWNDTNQSLEEYSTSLADNIADHGSVIDAVQPFVEMFDEANLGC